MSQASRQTSTDRPQVGFITDSFLDDSGELLEGGAERHLLKLVGVARQLDADVTVYQRGRRRRESVIDDIRVVTQPAPLPILGRVLAQKAAADGCTHLHFQYLDRVPWGLSGQSVTATSHGIHWDIPFVDQYRHWYPGGGLGGIVLPAWRLRERNRYLLAVGRCHRVLAVDTSLLRLVQAYRPNLRQRVDVVMNFSDLVDNPFEAKYSETTELFVEEIIRMRREGHVIVLVPRNLSFVRGGAWLCDIVERVVALCAPGQKIHFFLTGFPVDVYGAGDRYRHLFDVQLNGMSAEARGCIHLLDGVPHSSMIAAYRSSDMVLIPTFAAEGTSLAALEAMGQGVPVIATNVGGLNDAVQDGITGLLTPPDPEALALAVIQLAGDKELRARLGAEGRRMVAARFSYQHWRRRAEGFARRAGWAADGVAD